MVSFDLWIPALTKPKETFASAKKKASWGDAILQFVIAGVIAGLISGFIGGAAAASALADQPGVTVTGAGSAVLGGLGAIFLAITTPIVMVVGAFIVCAIIGFLVNAIFKRKGELKQFYYVVALYNAPLTIVNSVLGAIPVVGMLTFVTMLYGLYLLYLSIKEVYQL